MADNFADEILQKIDGPSAVFSLWDLTGPIPLAKYEVRQQGKTLLWGMTANEILILGIGIPKTPAYISLGLEAGR